MYWFVTSLDNKFETCATMFDVVVWISIRAQTVCSIKSYVKMEQIQYSKSQKIIAFYRNLELPSFDAM